MIATMNFITAPGLSQLCAHLSPGGVFAMWSNDPPDSEFVGELSAVLSAVVAEVIEFPNPYSGVTATCTIYLGNLGNSTA